MRRLLACAALVAVPPPHVFVGFLDWAPSPKLVLVAAPNVYGDERFAFFHGGKVAYFGPSVYNSAWSPAGNLLAYNALDSLETIRSDGTGRRVLRARDVLEFDAWSPDGRKLLFYADDGYLWVIGRDGRGAHRVSLVDSDFDPHAVWSPDGRHVAFQGCIGNVDVCESGAFDIFVVDIDGHERHRIEHTTVAQQCRLTWAPAHEIAYTTLESTIVVTQTGARVRTIRGLDCPLWSPDGTRLLGSVARTPAIAEPGRRTAHLAVRFHDREFTAAPPAPPVWSPDGAQIAYTRVHGSFDDPVSTVYVADSRTGRVQRLP